MGAPFCLTLTLVAEQQQQKRYLTNALQIVLIPSSSQQLH